MEKMNSKIKKNTGGVLRPVISLVKNNLGILIGLIIICVFMSFASPHFLTAQNIRNVLRQISSTLLMASSMTMILIIGGIDLSLGSIISLTGVITASFMTTKSLPMPVAIVCGLLVGIIAGSINGILLSKTKMPPFMITWCVGNICLGISYIYSNSESFRIKNDVFMEIGTGNLWGIPLPVIYTVVVVIFSYIVLNCTRLGRYMYAIGGNPSAAKYAGIDAYRVKLFAYVFSGFLASLAGIVITARSSAGIPQSGSGAEMDAIAAAVLGGTSMAGGSGRLSGTVIGALIIGTLGNGLNLMGINSFYQYILKGIVIILAVTVDYLKKGELKA